MSPLKYECLNCGSQWGNQEANDENISHGFCKRCLRDLMKKHVWNRQQKEGFSQCYAKGYNDCTEHVCAFFESCSDYVVQEWEKENINGKREKPAHL